MGRLRALWVLGLFLVLSGCAGTGQRVASQPTTVRERVTPGLLTWRWRRGSTAQPEWPPQPTPTASTATAATPPTPPTTQQPRGMARYFPGLGRRDTSVATAGDTLPYDPASRRASATVAGVGTRSGIVGEVDEPPLLPVVLNVQVYPDTPRTNLARTSPRGRETPAGRKASDLDTRQEPTRSVQAKTKDEVIPVAAEAIHLANDDESSELPRVVEADARQDRAEEVDSQPLDKPELAVDVARPDEAEKSATLPPAIEADPPSTKKAESELSRTRSLEDDPVLAGRPRLQPVAMAPASPPARTPEVRRRVAGPPKLPDPTFPASYYYATAPRPQPVPEPVPEENAQAPRRRFRLISRLWHRDAASESARGEPRDLAQGGQRVQ